MGGGGTGSEPGSKVQVMSESRWIGLLMIFLGLGVALLYEFVPENPTTSAILAMGALLLIGVTLLVVNPKGDKGEDNNNHD